MNDDTLSPTMQDALGFAMEHGGKLKRFPGGFWCRADLEHWSRPCFGTPTVEALVKRGVMAYTEWITGARARFPVEAAVLAKGLTCLNEKQATTTAG